MRLCISRPLGVMSHVGPLPHKVHQMGGFKMQGRTAAAAMEIIADAQAIEDAGATGTCRLLNGYDLRAAFDTLKPKFAKRYANLAEIATQAFSDYAEDVRSGRFPDDAHSYQMKPEEIERLEMLLNGEDNA